ncbi:hypothetical protein [Streptomyces sp. NPDC001480]|uniref:hypothetical protein n=1 Tax=Streptomyces sp. NPDC001480 TaxID=3364577 RepID=UPI0036C5644C
MIGVETNSRTDYDTACGTQLLPALNYLTQRTVRDRVDPDRLAITGRMKVLTPWLKTFVDDTRYTQFVPLPGPGRPRRAAR